MKFKIFIVINNEFIVINSLNVIDLSSLNMNFDFFFLFHFHVILISLKTKLKIELF